MTFTIKVTIRSPIAAPALLPVRGSSSADQHATHAPGPGPGSRVTMAVWSGGSSVAPVRRVWRGPSQVRREFPVGRFRQAESHRYSRYYRRGASVRLRWLVVRTEIARPAVRLHAARTRTLLCPVLRIGSNQIGSGNTHPSSYGGHFSNLYFYSQRSRTGALRGKVTSCFKSIFQSVSCSGTADTPSILLALM